MRPRLALVAPRTQCHPQRSDYKHLAHSEPVIYQLIDRRQRRHRLAHAHIQQKSNGRRIDDPPDRILLIRTRYELPTHR